MKRSIKNTHEITARLFSAEKPDSIVVPIGTSNDKCYDLVFSCRGRIGNNNGYAVYGIILEEINNFLAGLMCNACRKYSPAKLELSFYDCRDEADSAFDYVKELPNAKRVLRIESTEQLLDETEKLKEKHRKRLLEIGKYENCYARAVSAAAKQDASFQMAQELLVFVIPEKAFSEWESCFSVRQWLDLLMNEFWIAGTYPIVVVYGGSRIFEFRRYFASEVILFSSRNVCEEALALKSWQALISRGRDSWDWTAGGREVIDIPEYNDTWIQDTITTLMKKSQRKEDFAMQYYLYKNKTPFACDESYFWTFRFSNGKWEMTECIMSVLLYEDDEDGFRRITRAEALKLTDGVDVTKNMQAVMNVLYDDV